MSIYKDNMAPYALQICQQLVGQYRRLIEVEDDDDGESCLAAVGCVTALRRVLDAVKEQKELLLQLKPVLYPIFLHGLTPEGMDCVEDVFDCVTLLMYNGGAPMMQLGECSVWSLFPQMLYVVGGNDGDVDGGFGFEYLSQVAVCI